MATGATQQHEQAHATPDGRPVFTLTAAAKAAGVHRATIRRHLDAGAFTNAYRSDGSNGPETGPWLIPLADLIDAGLKLHAPGAGQSQEQVHATPADPDELAELRNQLAAAERRASDAERRAAVAEAVAAERERTIAVAEAALRALPAGEQPPPRRKRWGRV